MSNGEITAGVAYVGPSVQSHFVLCADCGTPIEPNGANLCVNCLRNSIDITEGIPKQAAINWCKGCSRYLAPPTQWVICDMESRELLAICLRKLKGLSKVRLIDAGFIWTEPHSKRLRVKLTIQKEVFSSTILQQIFEVEYIIQGAQCPECTRLAAKNTWRALVQVRQKVDHKRTFLYLEQLILKHNADKDTISVQEVKDGLNFFYATKQHAIKMVDFLSAIAPVRSKTSEQLISMDIQNSTTNSKLTYSVEIIPICKDDVVCLPLKVARAMSNISQIVICHRVGNQIYLIDPLTLTLGDISSNLYYRTPFPPLADITQATEFVVLDIEPTCHPPKTAKGGRFLLADAQVSPVGGSMNADVIYHTRTHLGAVLKPGDTVQGYMLASSNFNNDAWDIMNHSRTPEVILVRKTYPNRRKKSKARSWKLKSIVKDISGMSLGDDQVGLGRERAPEKMKYRGAGAAEQAKAEADYERFLRDLEEDEELRGTVNLYKGEKREEYPSVDDSDMETDNEEDDLPQIRLDELLDEMAEMTIAEDDDDAEE
ncbi:60S ribosomal export protein NMD3, partial [Phenoliferia sp. Uapishka_3]